MPYRKIGDLTDAHRHAIVSYQNKRRSSGHSDSYSFEEFCEAQRVRVANLRPWGEDAVMQTRHAKMSVERNGGVIRQADLAVELRGHV